MLKTNDVRMLLNQPRLEAETLRVVGEGNIPCPASFTIKGVETEYDGPNNAATLLEMLIDYFPQGSTE